MAKSKVTVRSDSITPKIGMVGCVVCDDVRVEDNGKIILIGVYAGDIVVPQFPADIPLRVYFSVRIEGAGTGILETEIITQPIGEDEFTTKIQGKVQFDSTEMKMHETGIPTPPLECKVERSSFLFVRWRSDGDDWQQLICKRIILQGDESRGEPS
tara:strand:- start:852 stop:1319 length:468 start_codon:yes stop_codon:yes gene_type:complete